MSVLLLVFMNTLFDDAWNKCLWAQRAGVFSSAVCSACSTGAGRRSRGSLWSIWNSFTSNTSPGSTTGTWGNEHALIRFQGRVQRNDVPEMTVLSGWTSTTWTTFLFSFWMLTRTSRAMGSNGQPSSSRFWVVLHVCFRWFVSTLLIWIVFSCRSKSFSPRCRTMAQQSSVWRIHWMRCVWNVVLEHFYFKCDIVVWVSVWTFCIC